MLQVDQPRLSLRPSRKPFTCVGQRWGPWGCSGLGTVLPKAPRSPLALPGLGGWRPRPFDRPGSATARAIPSRLKTQGCASLAAGCLGSTECLLSSASLGSLGSLPRQGSRRGGCLLGFGILNARRVSYAHDFILSIKFGRIAGRMNMNNTRSQPPSSFSKDFQKISKSRRMLWAPAELRCVAERSVRPRGRVARTGEGSGLVWCFEARVARCLAEARGAVVTSSLGTTSRQTRTGRTFWAIPSRLRWGGGRRAGTCCGTKGITLRTAVS